MSNKIFKQYAGINTIANEKKFWKFCLRPSMWYSKPVGVIKVIYALYCKPLQAAVETLIWEDEVFLVPSLMCTPTA